MKEHAGNGTGECSGSVRGTGHPIAGPSVQADCLLRHPTSLKLRGTGGHEGQERSVLHRRETVISFR
jgi:hypothetical protein